MVQMTANKFGKSDNLTFEKHLWQELLDTKHNLLRPRWKLNKRIFGF